MYDINEGLLFDRTYGPNDISAIYVWRLKSEYLNRVEHRLHCKYQSNLCVEWICWRQCDLPVFILHSIILKTIK